MTDTEVMLSDEELSTLIMTRHKLEIQVGLDESNWNVRVRGNGPDGQLHEDGFSRPNLPIPMTTAVWDCLIMFCHRYGLEV